MISDGNHCRETYVCFQATYVFVAYRVMKTRSPSMTLVNQKHSNKKGTQHLCCSNGDGSDDGDDDSDDDGDEGDGDEGVSL